MYADNVVLISDLESVAKKTVTEWTDLFEPTGLSLHNSEEHSGSAQIGWQEIALQADV